MLMIPSLLFVPPSLATVVPQISSARRSDAKKTKKKRTMQSKYIKNSNRMPLSFEQSTLSLDSCRIDTNRRVSACSHGQ